MVTLTCKSGHAVKVLSQNASKKLRCRECKEPLAEAKKAAAAEGDEPPRAAPAVKVSATRCPFCRELIDAGAEKTWVACSSCLARHHKPCWRESRKCASCGEKKPLVVAEKPKSRYGAAAGAVSGVPRLLSHEGHIRAIAFWDILTGAILGFMGLVFLLASAETSSAGGGVLAFLTLGLAVASFAGGVALWSYLGWGKWVTIAINYLCVALYVYMSLESYQPTGPAVQAILSVLWSAAVSWCLLSKNGATICTAAYGALVQKDAAIRPRWWASPFHWVPWALVLAVFGIAFANAVNHPHYGYGRGW